MRQTREVVLIIFAATVGFLAVSATIGLLLIELVNPETDTVDALDALWGVGALMLGAVLGYLLGRRNGA